MKVFTPKDVKEHKLASIPDFVYGRLTIFLQRIMMLIAL